MHSNTRRKLIALSIAVPGLVNAFNCPLITGGKAAFGTGMDSDWGIGAVYGWTDVWYSGGPSIDCEKDLRYWDCSGNLTSNVTYETGTSVTYFFGTWGKTSFSKAEVQLIAPNLGASAYVRGS
jgi:hypothetical protein